jgi:cytochrome c oxidase subunit II
MFTSRVQFAVRSVRVSFRDRTWQPSSIPWLLSLVTVLLSGCDGSQSSLDPAGKSADKIADLFWWMTIGAAIIWTVVVGLTFYSVHVAPGQRNLQASLMIIVGGTVVPTVVLSVLLVYGLAMMPEMLAPPPEGSLKIAVTGEQWWWRVRYDSSTGDSSTGELAKGERIELANEIRLPVGEPVEFQLESADVIHSFWIPSLGGKVDMIPGRRTRLKLEPTKIGTFRGACAEYCGASHALMTFYVVVSSKQDFEDWLAHQREPAHSTVGPEAISGARLFVESGCGACHTVRGTVAQGEVGPDLTHVGSRMSVAAGILPNNSVDFLHWLTQTHTIKPEVGMPSFSMLPKEDLRDLAAYLESLQ